MTINQKFFSLFPNQLNENELGALVALIGEAITQTKQIKSIFKIEETQYQSLFNYGRDRTDQVLSSLVAKKYITREQKRDESGKFDYNEIQIITDLVKD